MSVNEERRTKRLSWSKELLASCNEAIAAQQSIIEHDGALEAHALSLRSLHSQRKQLIEEILELEAAAGQS